MTQQLDDLPHESNAGRPAVAEQARLVKMGGVLGGVLLVGSVVILAGGFADPGLPTMPTVPTRPGQPGPLPSNLPSNFPTDLPDLPTEPPSNFPTDLPTLPELPELPGGNP